MWENLELFLSKKNLFYVLKTLEIGPKSLGSISKATGIRFEHVSKYIKELIEHDYVINLTPNIKKGKVFGISHSGKRILDEIKNKELID